MGCAHDEVWLPGVHTLGFRRASLHSPAYSAINPRGHDDCVLHATLETNMQLYSTEMKRYLSHKNSIELMDADYRPLNLLSVSTEQLGLSRAIMQV
jgi:hypothetical protein